MPPALSDRPLLRRGQQELRREGAARRAREPARLRGGPPLPPRDDRPERHPTRRLRWAWNFEQRYRGAGPIGRFKLVDLPEPRSARPRPISATSSWCGPATAPTSPRATTACRSPPGPRGWRAAASSSPSTRATWPGARSARADAETDWSRPDETFVYIPELRKARRAASAWVDGIYTPRYRVAGQNDAGLVPLQPRRRRVRAGHRTDPAERREVDRRHRGHPARLRRARAPPERLRLEAWWASARCWPR